MYRTLSGRVIFYLFFLLVVDLSVTPLIEVSGVRPLLSYLVILYVAFEWHWPRTFPIALFIGLLLDAVSSHPFGIQTVSLAAMSFVLDFLIYNVEHQSWTMRLLLTFLFVFLSTIIVWGLSSLLSDQGAVSWYSVVLCFQTAVYTTLITPVFFSFTSRWFSKRSVVIKQYELFDHY